MNATARDRSDHQKLLRQADKLAAQERLAAVAGSAEARERVALANADYEERRAADPTHRFNMRKVEREWKLKAGQLKNYRANRRRRKDSGVVQLFWGPRSEPNA